MRWPKTLRNLSNRISLKVAVVVTGLFAVLVLMMLGIVLQRSRQTFIDVIQRYDRYGYVFLEKRRIPIVEGQILPPQSYIDGPGEPADQQFANRSEVLLVWAAAIGIGGSLLIGLLISRLLTRPLWALSAGVKKLRHNHYRSRLPQNGPAEFRPLVMEFNQLAAELDRIEKLRKTLISDTSHELKTPITSLMTQLQAMRDGVIPADAGHLDGLINETRRLNSLVDSLQEYTRLRSQTMKPERSELRLREVAEVVRGRFDARLTAAGLKAENTIDSHLRITADRELLERLLSNLMENSLRYSRADTITLEANEHELVFRDNGVGIPREHWAFLFERFYRVEPSRNRQTGGLGLGLAIVKEIADSHGWTIQVGKPGDGKGVEFRIRMRKQEEK